LENRNLTKTNNKILSFEKIKTNNYTNDYNNTNYNILELRKEKQNINLKLKSNSISNKEQNLNINLKPEEININIDKNNNHIYNYENYIQKFEKKMLIKSESELELDRKFTFKGN
jgi:RPA family protein